MNTEYTPSDDDAKVLDALAAEPCGRANPYLLRDATGLSKQRVSNSLRQLVAAGWVRKVTRGLYDLVGDPRDTESVDSRIEAALEGWEPDTEARADTARQEAARAAEWLRESGERQTRSEFMDALAGDVSMSDRSWWERAAQPGLQRLDEEGLVEYDSGHHYYQWTG